VLINIRGFGFYFPIRVPKNLKRLFDFKITFKENSYLPRFVVGFPFLGVTLDVAGVLNFFLIFFCFTIFSETSEASDS
jgi:hypothetical protein